LNALGAGAQPANHRKRQRRENRDDDKDDQNLKQRKAPASSPCDWIC
jgi:hypothetical protein